jgi:hypothetical protein
MKEASVLEEKEQDIQKPKRKEIKPDSKSEYESKIKIEPKKKETKSKKSENSPPAQLKREPTKVEFKKEPTTIEFKKEQTPIELKKEPSKIDLKKESSKVEFKKEPTSIELKKSTPLPGNIEYAVKVIKGAGAFGAPISFVLEGEGGSTNTLDLNSKNSSISEINKIDEFKIDGKDVGKVLKMNLSYEGKGKIYNISKYKLIFFYEIFFSRTRKCLVP